jgi:hypothetical protein
MDCIAAIAPATADAEGYELRFQSLFHSGRALSFPCDASGSVHWQAMSERARSSFLRAREAVGVEFALPSVRLQG